MKASRRWLLVMTLALPGCVLFSPNPKGSSVTATSKGPYAGTVAGMPVPLDKNPRILIEHQPIPELGPQQESYSSPKDNVIMPFWIDAHPTSVQENHRVQFCVNVNWDSDRPVVVTAIQPLAKEGKPDMKCP
jgi:hypothetical protein